MIKLYVLLMRGEKRPETKTRPVIAVSAWRVMCLVCPCCSLLPCGPIFWHRGLGACRSPAETLVPAKH